MASTTLCNTLRMSAGRCAPRRVVMMRPLQIRAFQQGEKAKAEAQQQPAESAVETTTEQAGQASSLARPMNDMPRLPSLFRELEREMDALSRGFFGAGDIFYRSPLEGMMSTLRDLPTMPTWEAADLPMRLATDVTETDTDYLVKADVPGLSKDNIQVRVSPDHVLHITGERKEECTSGEEGAAGGAARRVERRFGRFSRAFVLPKAVDVDAIRAECADGVLTVTVPKKEQPEPQHKEIPVA